MKAEPRIGIVGCGAVAELRHLPALAKASRDLVALVDRDETRARRLAQQYEVPHVFTDHREILLSDVDAVIVATPTGSHASICGDLLGAGIHVLVEKPIALTLEQCDAMITAAEAGRAVLAVGMMRRFAHQIRFAKQVLDKGLLGALRFVDLREGSVFNWPLATDFPFRRQQAGGGVLIDLGVHSIDLLRWWTGEATVLEYRDNDRGGVESDCLLNVGLASGGEGVLEFSRTRRLRNTAVLTGEHGTLEVDLVRNAIHLELSEAHGLTGPVHTDAEGSEEQDAIDLMIAEHADWLAAAQGGGRPSVPPEDARRSLALVLDCYARRRTLELPWHRPERAVSVAP
jgi:predicted dehydrogenase